jgi:hypothetical protein
MLTKMAYIYEMKRKNGWIPESRRKRGRRAYESRVAGYLLTDPERYKKTVSKIVGSGDVARARRIKRKANKIKRERDGKIQDD